MEYLQGEVVGGVDSVEIGENTRGGGAASALFPADCISLRVERTVLLHNVNHELGGEEGKTEAGDAEENHGNDIIH